MLSPELNAKRFMPLLLSDKKPLEVRVQLLMRALQSGDPAATAIASELLKKTASSEPMAQLEEHIATYKQALAELENGGVRPATYIGKADGELPGPKPRAQVVTPDGQMRYPFLREGISLDDLRPGMTAYLDAKGAVILGTSNSIPKVGPQAQFVRHLPETGQIEITVRDEAATVYGSSAILDAAREGELKRGDNVLVCPNRQFAFQKIPENKDRRHRFVDRSNLPNVHPSKDIGSPHPCLGWLVRRTRVLLFREDLRSRFDQRPRVSLLMTGPSGTGKTLTIKAFLTLFSEMLIERTGLKDLESRVIRVKMSEHLSEWLGRSDKNFDQLFDDIQALAAEEVETASGERIRLPITVIFEEVEGIARRRSAGENDGASGAMDRILGTLLQRLDDPLDELSKLSLILISTSNRPAMIDVAMQRRLGAKVARFKRLDREGLAAVLRKKVKSRYPFASHNGTMQTSLRTQLIDEVVASLFSPANEESPLIELTLRDGQKIEKFSRDFLTGALVEQGLSDAIDQLVFYAEQSGLDDVGLDGAIVIDCLQRQIDAMAENIAPFNAGDYVDIPEHTQVANVRRIPRTSGRASQLVATGA
jgi:ATP-dependent 26S proteasome regulatory subunit